MDKPRVSVALCTCNGAKYLPAQLQSIAQQTRLPGQLVICDDHSTDSTLEIIANFSRTAAFPVEVRHNPLNLGSTRNFEQAISLCTGEIIALCDQDDLWRREKLFAIEAAFCASPNAGLVFSDALIVDENSGSTGRRLWQASGLAGRLRAQADKGDLFNVLLTDSRVTGATMAFRATLKGLIAPIPQSWMHDEWIALLASAIAPYVLIDEALVDYRLHAEQQVGPAPFTISGQVKPVFKQHRVRGSHYADMAAKFKLPLERLARLAVRNCPAKYVAALQEKIDHMEELSHLPEERWRRPRFIFGEMASGRYRRCSRGWITVAKDLLL